MDYKTYQILTIERVKTFSMWFVASYRLHFGSMIYQSFPEVSDKLTSQFTNSFTYFLFFFPIEAAASTLALTLAGRTIWAYGEVVLTLLLCRGHKYATFFFSIFKLPAKIQCHLLKNIFHLLNSGRWKIGLADGTFRGFVPKIPICHLPSAHLPGEN